MSIGDQTVVTTAEITIHIAALRGLYGDLAENLHDPDECNELWAQVETEHEQLAALISLINNVG